LGLTATAVAAAGQEAHGARRSKQIGRIAKEDPRVTHLQRELLRHDFPGLAGATFYTAGTPTMAAVGYADRAAGVRMSTFAVGRIASITKVISAMAILRLRDADKLTLDDRLSQHLPELAAFDPDAAPIRLRHLLTHTSGFARDVPHGNVTTEDAFIQLVAKSARTKHAAGSAVMYSNLAMGLVGPIVHRVSGLAFRSYVEREITRPLGMHSVRWALTDVEAKRRVTGYLKKTTDRTTWKAAGGAWQMGAAESFGGLYASIADLVTLGKFALLAWSSAPWAIGAPLSRETMREAQTELVAVDEGAQKHGACWWLHRDKKMGRMVHHSGATDDHSASLVLFPDCGVGAALMGNAPGAHELETAAKRLATHAQEG
jgi:CubicO group peptidase (beta-lactamase class C family)